jgi:hypothetical protein
MKQEISNKILDININDVQTFEFNKNTIKITLSIIKYKAIFKFYIYNMNVFINDNFYISITNANLYKVKLIAKDEVIKILNIVNNLK